MRRISLWSLVLTGLLGLFAAVPVAHAQFQLVANKTSLTDTTITPDPTTLATLTTNESPEIFALDVPPIPSSGYVLFTSDAVPVVNLTANAPLRAIFQLRFNLTSPALPPDIVLNFGSVLSNFLRTNKALDEGFEGGTATEAVVFDRKLFADFLQARNPSLTEAAAMQIAGELFNQGFHVSVFARLTSRNISDATVFNPAVAFFAQFESLSNP